MPVPLLELWLVVSQNSQQRHVQALKGCYQWTVTSSLRHVTERRQEMPCRRRLRSSTMIRSASNSVAPSQVQNWARTCKAPRQPRTGICFSSCLRRIRMEPRLRPRLHLRTILGRKSPESTCGSPWTFERRILLATQEAIYSRTVGLDVRGPTGQPKSFIICHLETFARFGQWD